MSRRLNVLLLSFALLLLAIALRGVPAAEPANAATVPSTASTASNKAESPAIGPNVIKAPATAPAPPAAESTSPTTAASGKGPVLNHCLVRLIQEVQVPGIEAGVLMSLEAKEGMDVRAGTTLGNIDDREPDAQRRISKLKHDASKDKAENDIDVRFARKAAEVAEYEYRKNKEAIDKVKGAISGVDVKKAELAAQKALLGIEKPSSTANN